jgi:predicted transcriptional regulator
MRGVFADPDRKTGLALTVLGQPHCLQVVRVLAERGAMTLNELVLRSKLSASIVRAIVADLVVAGLLVNEPQPGGLLGRVRVYGLCYPEFRAAAAPLIEISETDRVPLTQ